jgi:hypothetical protein
LQQNGTSVQSPLVTALQQRQANLQAALQQTNTRLANSQALTTQVRGRR